MAHPCVLTPSPDPSDDSPKRTTPVPVNTTILRTPESRAAPSTPVAPSSAFSEPELLAQELPRLTAFPPSFLDGKPSAAPSLRLGVHSGWPPSPVIDSTDRLLYDL